MGLWHPKLMEFSAQVDAPMLIGWCVASALTRPVLKLARAAEAVRAGDLSSRSEVRSKDEIGLLSSTFDGMASHLQRQHLSTIKALVSAIDVPAR